MSRSKVVKPLSISRFYETLHSSYFPLTESHRTWLHSDRLGKSLSMMRETRPRDLLEIGFENPELSEIVVDRLKVNYVGVDISQTSVDAGLRKGLKVLVVDVSEERLPFDDSSFDLVYFSEVLEHLYNPDFAMEEFKRVLRPGGRLLLTTPNLAAWYNRILLLVGIQPIHTEVSTLRILGRRFEVFGQGNRPVGHIRLYTHRALLDFLKLHSLRIAKLEGYGLWLVKGAWLVERLFSRFPSLASGFVVLLEKEPRDVV